MGQALVDVGRFSEHDLPVAFSANAGSDYCNTVSLFGRNSQLDQRVQSLDGGLAALDRNK